MKSISAILGLSLILMITAVVAVAEDSDWQSVLKDQKAKNAARVAAIEVKGEPIYQKLVAVNQQIKAHNAQHPSGTCEYPEGHPEVCTPWVNEGQQLDTKQEHLKSQLIPLLQEKEKLEAANAKIDQAMVKPN